MKSKASESEVMHASSVALGDVCALIIGASGTGKSVLALELMAYGAELIADDQTELSVYDNDLIANSPHQIQGQIEARGIGILSTDFRSNVKVSVIVDLDHLENERLPEPRNMTILGCEIPLVYPPQGVQLAPAILQFLKGKRIA